MDHPVDKPAAVDQPTPLAEKITAFLEQQGHPRPRDWLQGLPPVATAPGTPPDYQRFLINVYWREQIGTLPIDTMNVRYCLVDDGSVAEWLGLFQSSVVKCIVANNLPPALH